MFEEQEMFRAKKQITPYALKANELMIKNSTLLSQIELYQNYLLNIKSILSTQKNNQSFTTDVIFQVLSVQNNKIKTKNKKLKEEIAQTKGFYHKRMSRNRESLSYLTTRCDQEKENNFLLKNTLDEKDAFIEKYKLDLESIKKNCMIFEDVREEYMTYNKIINNQHVEELNNLQLILATKSRMHNQEKTTARRLQTELCTLREKISECSKSPQTIRGGEVTAPTTYGIEDILQTGNDCCEENIDESLLFDDFENEKEKRIDVSLNDYGELYVDNLLSELGKKEEKKTTIKPISLPIKGLKIGDQLNSHNQEKKEEEEKVKEKEKHKEKKPSIVQNSFRNQTLYEKLRKSSLRNGMKNVIPRLNLRQIEFNKVRVIEKETPREPVKPIKVNCEAMKRNRDAVIQTEPNQEVKHGDLRDISSRIQKLRREIAKEKDKEKKNKDLINKFDCHLIKMKRYVNDTLISIENSYKMSKKNSFSRNGRGSMITYGKTY